MRPWQTKTTMFSLKLPVTITSSDFFGSNFYNHFQQLTSGDLNAFSELLSPCGREPLPSRWIWTSHRSPPGWNRRCHGRRPSANQAKWHRCALKNMSFCKAELAKVFIHHVENKWFWSLCSNVVFNNMHILMFIQSFWMSYKFLMLVIL